LVILVTIEIGYSLWLWFRTGEKAELANKKINIICVDRGTPAVKIFNEYKTIIDAKESLENSQ
jgi:hypothetical protein